MIKLQIRKNKPIEQEELELEISVTHYHIKRMAPTILAQLTPEERKRLDQDLGVLISEDDHRLEEIDHALSIEID